MQVSDALEPLVHVVGLRHKLVAGGLSYTSQINALNKGVDILIATPGRLNDLLERGAVEMDDIRITVLDEADHWPRWASWRDHDEPRPHPDRRPAAALLSDPGQRHRRPGGALPHGPGGPLDRRGDGLGGDDGAPRPPHRPTAQEAHHGRVANRPGRTLVFCRSSLVPTGWPARLREQGPCRRAARFEPGARNRVLGAFRDGALPVLVATDVADVEFVDDVSVVLQVDPATTRTTCTALVARRVPVTGAPW